MVTRLGFLQGSVAAAAAGAASSRTLVRPYETALDRYIARPTPEYRYDVVSTFSGSDSRTRVIELISQQWRSDREVDRPIWNHWLTVTEPEHIRSPVALLVVSGGSNGDDAPKRVGSIVGEMVARTGAVVAELHNVPNQPLVFADASGPRSEDDLVAYSWDKYLRTGDETWPLRLPMTKAVVRAMDTIAALGLRTSSGTAIDRFIVGGSSKRGWTAWLTPVVDKRVVAIVPVVIDALNVAESAQHAHRVYGSWPEALRSYEKMGIMNWLGTPQLAALLSIEDPYSYRRRITVPKLVVNATGDQFFTPDSSQFYFGGLIGEKYLRYLPNTDHSLTGETRTAAGTGVAFVNNVIAGVTGPRYSWQVLGDGTLEVRSATEPLSVKLWQAVNRQAWDFRLQTIGKAFHDTELHDRGGFTYLADVSPPSSGFAAYFAELTYEMPHGDLFTVTTDVRVVPDVAPSGPPRHGLS